MILSEPVTNALNHCYRELLAWVHTDDRSVGEMGLCDKNPNTCRAVLSAVEIYWTTSCGGTPSHFVDVWLNHWCGWSCYAHERVFTVTSAE